MCRSPIAALVDQLAAADPAISDRAAIAALVDEAATVRCWLDALDTRLAQRVARLAAADGGDRPAAVLAGAGRRTGRDAATVERRAAAVELLPQLGDALAAGTVASGHVDAVARAVADLDESGRAKLQELGAAVTARAAAASSVDGFDREVRELTRLLAADDGLDRHQRRRRDRSLRRWVDRDTGMCHTHLSLDPETDAKVAAALDAAVAGERHADEASGEQRTFDQLKADAAVALIIGARSPERRVPEVSVLIDLATLSTVLHDTSVCETAEAQPVPPDAIRRMACEATIIPIVLDSDSVVVDVGRARRVATREQRQALRAMYPTCGFPGCGARFGDCDIHHVTPWQTGGGTDLDNLVPLCSVHHHVVHEGHWTLTLQPDRTITVTRPDGTIAHEGRTTNHRSHQPSEPVVVVAEVQAELATALARFRGPPPRAPAA